MDAQRAAFVVLFVLQVGCLEPAQLSFDQVKPASAALVADTCSAARIDACDNFACGCVDNECSGGFCPNVDDACSDGRREGCLNAFGCGCYNETCTGLLCATPTRPPALSTATDFDIQSERDALLSGITDSVAIDPGALTGPVGMFDRRSFPVLAKGEHTIVAASATFSGRAVAFGHVDFFSANGARSAATRQLLQNAASWVTPGKPAPSVGVVGAADGVLSTLGMRARQLTAPITASSLEGLDAIALNGNEPRSPSEIEALIAFNIEGGGLLVAALGWPWNGALHDMPGNAVLARVGLGFTRRYAEYGPFPVQASLPMDVNAVYVFNWLHALAPVSTEEQSPEIRRVQDYVVDVIPLLVRPSPLLVALEQLVPASEVDYPTWDNPVTNSSQPLLSLGYRFMTERVVSPSELLGHDGATDFPGSVPGTGPSTHTVAIDTRVPNWHSTGLYAAPGREIVVKSPGQALGSGLRVLIGAHTDTLWGSEPPWLRLPAISRSFALDQPVVSAANEVGGLIYIDVPSGAVLGTIDVTIENAVEAPYYVLGVTSDEGWNEIRTRPAPWGELATDNVIFTVPSSFLRNLSAPSEILTWWQRAIRVQDDFAHWPAGRRKRADRAVFDRQISLGYMHAGYPVMAPVGWASDREKIVRETFDVRSFTEAPQCLWGLLHEFGHEHQNYDWTFDGTGEVTNNLWTMVTIERVTGYSKEQGIRDVTAEGQKWNMCQYFYYLYPDPDLIKRDIVPMTFDHWKDQPFIALQMYIQLMDRLLEQAREREPGVPHDAWAPYERMIQDYIDHPLPSGTDDATKRDEFLIRMSRAAGRNLVRYFDTWKIPVSDTARDAVRALDLPDFEWTPPARSDCPAQLPADVPC